MLSRKIRAALLAAASLGVCLSAAYAAPTVPPESGSSPKEVAGLKLLSNNVPALSYAGHRRTVENTPHIEETKADLLIPSALVTSIIALCSIVIYSITGQKALEIRAELERLQRKAGGTEAIESP